MDELEERYRDSETILEGISGRHKRAFESKDPAIRKTLAFRIEETRKMNKDKIPYIDEDYYCETCGSHTHQCDPDSGNCFICNMDNWQSEDE